jgi:hypothetical protein
MHPGSSLAFVYRATNVVVVMTLAMASPVSAAGQELSPHVSHGQKHSRPSPGPTLTCIGAWGFTARAQIKYRGGHAYEYSYMDQPVPIASASGLAFVTAEHSHIQPNSVPTNGGTVSFTYDSPTKGHASGDFTCRDAP